jgi:polyphenol oxidase
VNIISNKMNVNNLKHEKNQLIDKSLNEHYIVPQWPLADSIKSLLTTRKNGFSQPPWDSFNLATHVNDKTQDVKKNREILKKVLPAEPFWLDQVHSHRIVSADNHITAGSIPKADGSYSLKANQVCAVLTADCLPLLFASTDASAVAAIHAGWRGLASGIIDNAVNLLCRKTKLSADQLLVWLGPAISKQYFEVGFEVKEQFICINPQYAVAFTSSKQNTNQYMADIYLLARINLQQLGVTKIYGGDFCSYADKENFYSYRRDGISGRMVSLIWKT